jgi:endonuclease/exonuclease/phosphatase family protein
VISCRRAVALAVLVLAGVTAQPAEAAKSKPKKDPRVTVMSRNLYLGADLTPAFSAGSICEAIDAGGQILDDVDASSFPSRSKLLAREVAKVKPDLLGLQEAALWRFQENADYTGSPATEVRYDFLKTLQGDLRAAGVPYRVAVVQEEFDQELPADRDRSDATADPTFPLCGADEDGRLTMRDAILVRKGSKVRVSGAKKGQFDQQLEISIGGVLDVRVARGWVSVEGAIAPTKKTRGARLHFVNTHLEAFGDPSIREDQARELFAPGGPLRTRKQLIALGDFNSGGPKDRVGTGFTVPGDEGAYNALTQDFGLIKLGARQTCCFSGVDPAASPYAFLLDHTVDHIFVKPRIKQLKTAVTGANASVVSPEGLVASDHGGVYSVLRLR